MSALSRFRTLSLFLPMITSPRSLMLSCLLAHPACAEATANITVIMEESK